MNKKIILSGILTGIIFSFNAKAMDSSSNSNKQPQQDEPSYMQSPAFLLAYLQALEKKDQEHLMYLNQTLDKIKKLKSTIESLTEKLKLKKASAPERVKQAAISIREISSAFSAYLSALENENDLKEKCRKSQEIYTILATLERHKAAFKDLYDDQNDDDECY